MVQSSIHKCKATVVWVSSISVSLSCHHRNRLNQHHSKHFANKLPSTQVKPVQISWISSISTPLSCHHRNRLNYHQSKHFANKLPSTQVKLVQTSRSFIVIWALSTETVDPRFIDFNVKPLIEWVHLRWDLSHVEYDDMEIGMSLKHQPVLNSSC